MGRIEKESAQQINKKEAQRGCMSRPEILTGVTYFCCCPTDFTTQFSYQQSSRRAEGWSGRPWPAHCLASGISLLAGRLCLSNCSGQCLMPFQRRLSSKIWPTAAWAFPQRQPSDEEQCSPAKASTGATIRPSLVTNDTFGRLFSQYVRHILAACVLLSHRGSGSWACRRSHKSDHATAAAAYEWRSRTDEVYELCRSV
jgi:hypothetical protein